MTPPFLHQFTVFTPTYNRSHTLHRVYESLIAQTYSDFEWLVIDDGSTDDTRSRIEAWQTIAPFKIRYIYQSPQGKHAAYNRAALESEGEFLICLDSDDSCLPYALERMRERWDEIPVSDQSRYSGIDCHCMDDQGGHRIGTDYPSDGFISNYPEMRHRYQVTGEKWGFQRTVVMRKYPFPVFNDLRMSHIPESVVWSPMTMRYPVLYVNECWRVYQQEIPPEKLHLDQLQLDQLQLDKLQSSDVQPTIEGSRQLTKQNLTVTNPVGSLLLNQTLLNVDIQYFKSSPLTFFKAAINYNRARWHVRDRISSATRVQLRSQLTTVLGQFMCGLMLPISYWLYRHDLNAPISDRAFAPD